MPGAGAICGPLQSCGSTRDCPLGQLQLKQNLSQKNSFPFTTQIKRKPARCPVTKLGQTQSAPALRPPHLLSWPLPRSQTSGCSPPPVWVSASWHQALSRRGWDGRPVPTNPGTPGHSRSLGCVWERGGGRCAVATRPPTCMMGRQTCREAHSRDEHGPTPQAPHKASPPPMATAESLLQSDFFVSKLIGNTFWQRETQHFGRLRRCAQTTRESSPQCCLQGGGQ